MSWKGKLIVGVVVVLYVLAHLGPSACLVWVMASESPPINPAVVACVVSLHLVAVAFMMFAVLLGTRNEV